MPESERLTASAGGALVLGGGAAALFGVATTVVDGSPDAMAAVAVGVFAVLVVLSTRIEPAWLFSAAVALTAFSANSDRLGFPVGPDRLLFALGVLSLVVKSFDPQLRAAMLGRLRFGVPHALLAILTGLAIVSAAWAGTLTEREPFFGLLDRLGLIPFFMFLIAPVVFPGTRERAVLLAALVALGGYLGITALAEAFSLDALVFPKYILDTAAGIHQDRARGPFLEAVPNGFACFVCGVAAAVAASTWRGVRRSAALAVIGLCAAGTLFTLTRSVWIGTTLGTLTALVYASELRRWIVPAVAVGVLTSVLLLNVVPGLSASASERSSAQRPVWDRLNSDRAALAMIQERPVTGFGWYRFTSDSEDYFRQGERYPLTNTHIAVHNMLLSNSVELGVPVAILWLIAFGCAIAAALRGRLDGDLRAWQIGFAAIVIHFLVIANLVPLGYASTNLFIWLWAGIVVGHRRSAKV